MNLLNILAAILLWAAQAGPSGSISGTIRSQTGGPAPRVRVVAIAVTEPDAIESTAQTDTAGHYRLENLAPGRYYVAAGPAAVQTFHPGTSSQSVATIVTVTPDAARVSRMDFQLGTLASPDRVTPLNPLLSCCNLNFVTEDRRLLPDFPEGITVKNLSNNTSINVVRAPNRGPVGLRAPVNGMAEVAIQNLPPGYVLKSVALGGKDKGLNPFSIGEPADIDLIIGYDLSATSKKVAVRGKVINAAPESKMKTIRFTSTIPNGPALEAPLQPDGSFEFSEIPIGAYQTGGHNDAAIRGLPMGVYTIVVLRDNVSGLTLNMQSNPFPEFVDGRPERIGFPGGKSTEITGVITSPLRKIGTGDAAYFLMNVKDASTGAVTPWAVFAEHADDTPQTIVGETITVPGVVASDGTNRMSAYPF